MSLRIWTPRASSVEDFFAARALTARAGGLNTTSQNLTLYLLSGPQTNRIGLFHLSTATAAEDLNAGGETLRERLADVSATFGWPFDSDARVFYIPSWWRWNPPQNANVLKGNLRDLTEIQPSGLVDAFARNLTYIPETLHQTFVEGLRLRLPQRLATQEQYQKPFHEQEAGAPALARATNGAENGELVSVIRKIVKSCGPNQELDYYVSHANDTRPKEKKFKKAEVLLAVNVVIAELRASA